MQPIIINTEPSRLLRGPARAWKNVNLVAEALVNNSHMTINNLASRAQLARMAGLDETQIGRVIERPGFVKVYKGRRLKGVYYLPSVYDMANAGEYYPHSYGNAAVNYRAENWPSTVLLPVDKEAKATSSNQYEPPWPIFTALGDMSGKVRFTPVPYYLPTEPVDWEAICQSLNRLMVAHDKTEQQRAAAMAANLVSYLAYLREDQVT